MAKGSETSRNDVGVSPIRAGMKREFMAMMKAQVGYGVPVGSRRCTRSQNVSLRSGSVLKSPVRDGKLETKRRGKETKRVERGNVGGEEIVELEKVAVVSEDDEPKSGSALRSPERDRKSGAKRRRKEMKRVEVEKEGEEEVVEKESENGEKVVLMSEDDEPKSGVLVGKSEAKRRRKETGGVEMGKEGEEVTMGLEKVEEKGSEIGEKVVVVSEDDEPKSDVLDGSLEEDEKAEVVEVTKGNVGSLSKLENMGVKGETETGMEKNKVDIESNIARINVDIENIDARTNPEIDSIDGKPLETDKNSLDNDVQENGDYLKIEPGNVNDTTKEIITENVEVLDNCATPKDDLNSAVVDAEESQEVSVADKPLRRITRSSLKEKHPPPETSRGGINDMEPLEKDHTSTITTPNNIERSSVGVSGTKSHEPVTSSIPRSKSKGRLTRKDLRKHRLVFENDVLEDGTALAYYSRGKKMLEGYKKGFGIFCYCCESEVSPSVFEAHAGFGSRRKPYLSIYISNGVSLHELSVRLAQERKFSAAENDDLCSICADGGDLLCCDSCPRAFHADCVSLPSLPQGAWHCRYCENTFLKEKFVEHNANAIAAGRVLGDDPLEQLMTRCIRIVENLDSDSCACVLCRGKDFSKSGFGPQTVIICDQCEKEYHIGCLKEHNMDHLNELPEGKWFCCVECNKVHTALEKLVADGEMQIPEFLLATIKEKHANLESNDISDLNVKWRLLRGKQVNEETRKLLSGAVTIFHERFDPIADANTSRLDLIPQMVYGRNFKEQDLGGMYTAVLMVNSTVVCAGIIRIFGQVIAELPLVATCTERQGQGYFQCLFACMENLLASLDVKSLVLPAAEEAESLWTNKFGFEKITDEEMKDYRKDYQMMIFQGTSMLHKLVHKSSNELVRP
ncbi:hypothetical protein LIER_00451 [Lithospermum erythrorhizon]|uniref:PHD-type domain-containing protein n=1 Tax=Lithospermum erythrorhizon TaxID=34254 RepID=A0AAV3NIN7_LITER